MAQPLVSIIMPCYNYAEYVGDAIGSILAQTYGHFEVIIVDDGSTDGTPAILAEVTDPRFRVVRQENAGAAAARNTGRGLARGQFITFLDADDLWRPTFLERQMAVFEAEPDVEYCFANMVRTENGQVLQTQFDLVPRLRAVRTRPSPVPGAHVILDDTFAALAPSPDPPGWLQASVFRRVAIDGTRSREGIPNAEDLYLLLQIYACTRAAFIDDVLVEIRRHGRNSYRNHDQIRNAVLRVLQLVHEDIALSPAHRRILEERIGAEQCRRGWRYFWDGDVPSAARHYFAALKWPGSRLNAAGHLALLPAVPFLPHKVAGFEERPA